VGSGASNLTVNPNSHNAPKELRSRAANLRFMATMATQSERLAGA